MGHPDVYDDAIELAKDRAIPPETAVRMRFTGTRLALVAYGGKKGRSYRGSAAPGHQVADVHPDDVELLLRSGEWELVAPSA